MFEKELKYFIKHQKELVRKHEGKVLTIKGDKVVGVFDSPLDAYLDLERNHELGKVMIQPCEAGQSAYTVSLANTGLQVLL